MVLLVDFVAFWVVAAQWYTGVIQLRTSIFVLHAFSNCFVISCAVFITQAYLVVFSFYAIR